MLYYLEFFIQIDDLIILCIFFNTGKLCSARGLALKIAFMLYNKQNRLYKKSDEIKKNSTSLKGINKKAKNKLIRNY